jgi:transcriptional regulator with XRE-family HTH domain
MSTRERRTDRALWLMRRDLEDLGADLRSARLMAGLRLRDVANSIGTSPQAVLRTERARFPPGPFPDDLARHAAAVGMRARIKVYPEGPPIRDVASIALMREFRERLGKAAKLLVEQAVTAEPLDRRAFDATLDIPPVIALEFVTRFHDCQAQLRAAQLKQRDSGLGRLIIVVRATHANRRAVAAAADIVATTFPLGTRSIMSALEQGRDPGANGLVFI